MSEGSLRLQVPSRKDKMDLTVVITHVVDCNSNHLDFYLNVWKIRNIKCMLNYPLVIPASSEPVNALEN